MDRIFRPTFTGLFASLAILMSLPSTRAATQSYCSTQNTGTNDADSTYQSHGWCTTHCNDLGTFAFAVVKWKSCSCSNYIPADQTDISNCQKDCPGYPDEKCGNKDDDLYVYLKLDGSPSGTIGGSQSTSAAATSAVATAMPVVVTSAAVSSSKPVPPSTKAATSTAAITPPPAPSSRAPASSRDADPVTVIQTVIRSVPPTTVVLSLTSSSATSSTFTSTTSTHEPPTTLETSPIASVIQDKTTVQVVTESGAVVIRTVVLTPTSVAASDPAQSASSNSNTGAIVGGVVGGVAGLALIAGLIIFFLWRRRKQRAGQGHEQTSITRNTSTMSKAGLLGGKSEKDTQYPPKIATRYGSQNSRYDPESHSPTSASGRRYSQPLVFDSRLNPTQLMVFDNGSRGSIDDSADYGRRLGVANPDPPNRASMDHR